MIPGSFTVGVCDIGIATPQGFDAHGLARAAGGAAPERAMLRPEALKGRALVIDPASALAASLAVRFRANVFADTPAERLGIVVASRFGSATAVRDFADRVRRGSSAPAAFAASGYNAAAGFSAMACLAQGPSLALAGHSASLQVAVQRAGLYLARGDADAMIAIACESLPGSTQALALGVALRHPEAAPMILSDSDFAASADPVPAGAFEAFAWLWPGIDSLFGPCLTETQPERHYAR